MQNKNKTLATIIAVLLISSMAASLVVVQPANAGWSPETTAAKNAGMKWDFPGAENYNASATRLLLWERYHDKIPTYVYGVISPNPIGVNQEVTLLLINPVAPPGSDLTNDIRYEFSVAITAPDGTKETIPASGTITSDSTGSTYTRFTPTKVGNYTVTIIFHQLLYHWYEGVDWLGNPLMDYYGVTFLESNQTYTLVVQKDPVSPNAITNYPLPTEYWTRPIEGQNQAWAQISSNWLSGSEVNPYGNEARFQQNGMAPNSGHVLWTKPIEDAGVVGGGNFSTYGQVFNPGDTYNPRLFNEIIMHGRLYYEVPSTLSGGYTGNGGGWMCVDLRTGQTIWGPLPYGVFESGMPSLSFGYYYELNTPFVYGVANPGWIFAEQTMNWAGSVTVINNTWYSVHPRYGTFGQFNVTNVPSGIQIVGPKGEILIYVVQDAGTSTNPNYRLLQWNSSRVFPENAHMWPSNELGTFDASSPSAYDWNISLPIANQLKGGISIQAAIYDDVLLCYNGTLISPYNSYYVGFGYYAFPEDATLFAVSLKPESLGQTLFGPTNYKMAFSDGTRNEFIDAGEGVFIMKNVITCTFSGYSMYTGQKLWEGISESAINPLAAYSTGLSDEFGYTEGIAYGKFYSTGYSGHVLCYDLYNGSVLWEYAAPTNAQILNYYTLLKGAIADGKIYVGCWNHAARTPLYKGEQVRCLNASTGQEVWTLLGYAEPYSMAVADGVLTFENLYDGQLYAIGKGPSAMTVEAPAYATKLGGSIVIRGTVTDIAAGTKQDEQAARFPNGVPAVSDASQGKWMEYIYMQKPRPTDATGVPVTINVVDANGNYREIGSTITSDGFFTFNWKPDIEGQYTVYASFAGSESYWPSHALTSFAVDPAAPTPAPAATPTTSMTDAYFIPAVAGIIVAIVIVGIVLALLVRKRP